MSTALDTSALRLSPSAPASHKWREEAGRVAAKLADTAVARDRRGGHAGPEREIIRNSGLLTLSIPAEYGGQAQPWSVIFDTIRILAREDSALAHLYGFHHLQVGSVLLYGSDDQKERLLRTTAANALFWGNTLNPRDRRTVATARDGGQGYVFHGEKGFCSGALGSDFITASAWHRQSESLVVAALPTQREGITVHEDWDAIGQRQTDSGSVTFNLVQVNSEDVLLPPGKPWTPSAQFRSCLAQLVLVNLYTGIAEGAFQQARRYTLEKARPWLASDAETSADDLYIQRHYGQLWVQLRAAQTLADIAARTVDDTFAKAPRITAEERGDAAVAIAEAKVAAHHAALDISTRLFDLAGASAARRDLGFDRFWRNARTHTLHDPLDYKLRDLGRWSLHRRYPEPTSYS